MVSTNEDGTNYVKSTLKNIKPPKTIAQNSRIKTPQMVVIKVGFEAPTLIVSRNSEGPYK